MEYRKNQYAHLAYIGGYVRYRVEHFEPLSLKMPSTDKIVVAPPRPEEVLAEVIALGDVSTDAIFVRGKYGELWLHGQQWNC